MSPSSKTIAIRQKDIYIGAKKNAKPDSLGGNGKYVVEDQSSPVDGEVIQCPQYSVTAGRRETTE